MARTQNLYDDPEFFAQYLKYKDSYTGQAGLPNLDAAESLLPNLESLSVLDLGCGDGWFSRLALNLGAKSSHGIDVSKLMLERARKYSRGANATYATADLNQLGGVLGASMYDFVFSSLALHYVTNFADLAADVYKCLKPGGCFYFSIEHPMHTAPESPSCATRKDGKRRWQISNYSDEGERATTWLTAGVIKQHRTLETYINVLIGAGFELTKVKEWGKPDSGHYKDEKWYVAENVMPCYLMLGVRKAKFE